MKTIFLTLALAVSLVAQTVVNPASLTFSPDATLATQAWMITQTNGLQGVTLSSGIDAVTLTVTVSDASSIKANDELVIDNEAVSIASKSGNVLTLTARADLGTTAATHAAGTKVDTLKYSSLKTFCKLVVAATVQDILDRSNVGAIATQNAVITTAQAARQAAKANAVQ